MPAFLLLAFVAVPLIEIAVFIEVGGILGLWPTLGLVVLTAIVGVSFLRQQGLATLRRVQASINRNELPLREVFDGACLLVAGALLLTPGFFTDGLGVLLLIPAFRAILLKAIGRRLVVSRPVWRAGAANANAHNRRPKAPGEIIEGDYEEVPPDADDGDTAGTGRGVDDSRWGGERRDD